MTETPKPSKSEKRLRAACYMSLLALALMSVSFVYPKPLAVIVAMSVAQLIGTISFALFLFVVAADFRRSRILDRQGPSSLRSPDSSE